MIDLACQIDACANDFAVAEQMALAPDFLAAGILAQCIVAKGLGYKPSASKTGADCWDEQLEQHEIKATLRLERADQCWAIQPNRHAAMSRLDALLENGGLLKLFRRRRVSLTAEQLNTLVIRLVRREGTRPRLTGSAASRLKEALAEQGFTPSDRTIDNLVHDFEVALLPDVAANASFLFAALDPSHEMSAIFRVPRRVVLDQLLVSLFDHKGAVLSFTKTRNSVERVAVGGENLVDTDQWDARRLSPALIRACELVGQAQRVAKTIDESCVNVLMQGRLKEIVIADGFGHRIVPAANGADALDGKGQPCEYLCSDDGKPAFFVIDRPHRLKANSGGVYCVVWNSAQNRPRRIYCLHPDDALALAGDVNGAGPDDDRLLLYETSLPEEALVYDAGP